MQAARLSEPVPATFVAGPEGQWTIVSVSPVSGEGLAVAPCLSVWPGLIQSAGAWVLRGVAGHPRYVTRTEKEALARVQPLLGRPEATRAALIPIRKSAAWWSMAQDERRAVLEERSHHIERGLEYLPAVARLLYQCRELGEPFDFITWFEYAPEHAEAFEELVQRLRATEEWAFVEREVDVRLARQHA